MSHRLINIVSILFLFLICSEKIFSQSKYYFDFNSEWGWEDLINKIALTEPQLINQINFLKKELSIEDGRKIFAELSKLESLNDIKKLYKVADYDYEEEKIKWDTIFKKEFKDWKADENFKDIIFTVIKLNRLRKSYDNSMFEFKNKEYLPQPAKKITGGIDLNFDYNGAESILSFFVSDSINDSRIRDILNTHPYNIVINNRNCENVSNDDLNNFLMLSKKSDNLFEIYKWINPRSFWNFGGVFIYKEKFQDVIRVLKENEGNIEKDVSINVTKYLPDSTDYNVDVFYLFGKKFSVCLETGLKLGLEMEYFGDNYEHIISFLIHNIFKIALKEIQLPVDEYIVDENDRLIVNILSRMLENGASNYVGPVGTETRPWYLLEKDFKLFNRTFKEIYNKNKNTGETDSLINSGFAGDAPFYTMTTQMAYIIETTLGRNALKESIQEGPIAFFNKYVDAYKEYFDKIREVFRFSQKFEDKIRELKKNFPENIMNDALKIKKFKSDVTVLNKKIFEFQKKYIEPEHEKLINFLIAQLYFEADNYEKAREYFLKGLEHSVNYGKLSGKVGEAFLRRNAYNEAMEFFNLYVENFREDANAYELRGEYFYKIGDNENARKDFEKAIEINPDSKVAKIFLTKINSQL